MLRWRWASTKFTKEFAALFRNRAILTILNFCLAFLAVFIFLEIQQRDVVIKLNNHNLSLDTYRVEFKENLTAKEIDQRLNDSAEIKDVQVHYRPRGTKKITYFFGKGSFATPPLVSGNFFSKNDFKSDLSVAVVGQKLAPQLYQPKDQQYLKLNNRYIPVIGVMGEKIPSNLDQQIFIAPSQSKLATMKVQDYDVMIDGDQKLAAQVLKQTLPLKKLVKIHANQFVMSRWEWMTSHWFELIGLLAIFAVMLLEIGLWIVSSRQLYQEALRAGLRSAQLALSEWQSFSLFSVLGLLGGSLIGALTFSLQDYGALITYLGVGFAIVSLLFNLCVRRSIKKIK